MKTLAILSALIFLVGCNAKGNKTNIEIINNMMDQVSVKSQDWVPEDGDKPQMRMPPAGTVPRGYTPYKYADDSVAAERQPNPLAGDNSPETLELGRKNYDIYCAVCHGASGDGSGTVAERFTIKPRNLINAEAKAYSDGRIYYAITAGRGVMGAYASQIPSEKARWAIVNYVRTLQR